jgi:carbon storage regulator
MLVLTRKTGEVITVDGHIRVTVVSIGGGKVRIGIEAPPEVRVDRAEIHLRRNEFADQAVESGVCV